MTKEQIIEQLKEAESTLTRVSIAMMDTDQQFAIQLVGLASLVLKHIHMAQMNVNLTSIARHMLRNIFQEYLIALEVEFDKRMDKEPTIH
jgi:hypothetical protein